MLKKCLYLWAIAFLYTSLSYSTELNIENEEKNTRIYLHFLPPDVVINISEYLSGQDFLNLASTFSDTHKLLMNTPSLFLPSETSDLSTFLDKTSFKRICQVTSRTSPSHNKILIQSLISAYDQRKWQFDELYKQIDNFLKVCTYFDLAKNLKGCELDFTLFQTQKKNSYDFMWTLCVNEYNDENKKALLPAWEQAAVLDLEARQSLIEAYHRGNQYVDKNEARAEYWEKFSPKVLLFNKL